MAWRCFASNHEQPLVATTEIASKEKAATPAKKPAQMRSASKNPAVTLKGIRIVYCTFAFMKIFSRIGACLIVAHLACSAVAQTAPSADMGNGNLLSFQVSPYTRHNTFDEEHKRVVAVGLEREYPTGKLDGISLFRNSFGQPSAYLYPWGGVYHSIGGIRPLSFKWTAGLLYGYKEPYERKVPLNYKGFSPGAVISLAYEVKPGWAVQVNMLGTAAFMLQFNAPLN